MTESEGITSACSAKQVFLKLFAKFTGKRLCQSLINKVKCFQSATFFKKRPQHRFFPVIFAKILRTPFSWNSSGWLLLRTDSATEPSWNILQKSIEFKMNKSVNVPVHTDFCWQYGIILVLKTWSGTLNQLIQGVGWKFWVWLFWKNMKDTFNESLSYITRFVALHPFQRRPQILLTFIRHLILIKSNVSEKKLAFKNFSEEDFWSLPTFFCIYVLFQSLQS